MTSAVDGVRCAQALLDKYEPGGGQGAASEGWQDAATPIATGLIPEWL